MITREQAEAILKYAHLDEHESIALADTVLKLYKENEMLWDQLHDADEAILQLRREYDDITRLAQDRYDELHKLKAELASYNLIAAMSCIERLRNGWKQAEEEVIGVCWKHRLLPEGSNIEAMTPEEQEVMSR